MSILKQLSTANTALDKNVLDITPSRLSRPPSLTLKISNAVAYVLIILVNIASAKHWLGPFNNYEASNKYFTPLTPAGWAFSIWGVIFCLQGAAVVYALLSLGDTGSDGWKQRVVNTVGYGWQVGWYFEVAWQLFFAQGTAGAQITCMFMLLGAFAAFFVTLIRLYKMKDEVGSLSSALLYVMFFLPTSLNAAWLSVAAAIGILIVPTAFGFAHLEVGAINLAAIITALGFLVVQRERDSAYGLTLVWAFVALYGGQTSSLIQGVALSAVAIMTLVSIFSVLRRRQRSGIELTDAAPRDVRTPLNRSVD